MGNLNLSSDEPIILATQNIVVKSVRFEAILTNKRLILVDSRNNTIQSNDIPLEAIRTVEAGENAIRDPIITLSLIAGTGETVPLVLTFSQKPRERRKRECDEWVKKLKEHIPSSRPEAARATGVPSDLGPVPRTGVEKPHRIGIIHADKTTVNLSSVPKKPVETSSLPSGVFCSRCGNRVPLQSEFCNRCGTKIIMPQDEAAGTEPVAQPVPEPVAQPVPEPVTQPVLEPIAQPVPEPVAQPVPEPVAQPVPEPVTQPVLEPAVPQVSVPVPQFAVSAPEKKERPIEQEIHSIEPLIADSVPRTEPAPIVPSQPVAPPAEGIPILPSYPHLPPLAGAPSRRPKYMVIIALILVIVAVAGAAFIFSQSHQEKPEEPSTPATTPTITTAPTKTQTPTIRHTPTPQATTQPSSTPQVTIPTTGVWVRVEYPGTFAGLIGTPGSQRQVTDSGDRLYQIPTSEGTVAVSIQKQDGSGDLLKVGVYKNGVLAKLMTTAAPGGSVDLQVDLKSVTPTPSK